jgi:hypothetical protein
MLSILRCEKEGSKGKKETMVSLPWLTNKKYLDAHLEKIQNNPKSI